MATESNTLKDERINDTNTAANNTDTTSTEVKSEIKEVIVDKKDVSKNNTFRMIGYPLTIGSLLGLGGSMLASKLNKNKKVFAIAGILVGVGLGYTLFLNYEKKNLGK